MKPVEHLETERLTFRPWQEADLDPLARLTSDPKAMEFFPKQLSREESDEYGRGLAQHFEIHGFGVWLVERRESPGFIGFCGLKVVNFEARFTPATEISYRFLPAYWKRGYATEAGRAAVSDGFERVGLDRIVGFTSHPNVGSQRVLERVGFRRVPEHDFDHPMVDEGHRLRPHLFYEIRSS